MYYTLDPLIKKWFDELEPWWVDAKSDKLKADAPEEIVKLKDKLFKRIKEYQEEVVSMK